MAYKCLSLCDFFIVQQFFKLCHICLVLLQNLHGFHFHIGIIRHLGEILHQEINILLDSPDGSFQCRIVDSVDSFLRSRAVLRVQNFVHDLLADACFRRGGRNCVNLTQFLLSCFLRSYCILPSGTLSALHGAVLQRLRSNLFGISINNNQEGNSFCCHPLDYYLLFPRFGFLSDIYNLELV